MTSQLRFAKLFIGLMALGGLLFLSCCLLPYCVLSAGIASMVSTARPGLGLADYATGTQGDIRRIPVVPGLLRPPKASGHSSVLARAAAVQPKIEPRTFFLASNTRTP
jgi:hypothetical protein